MNTHRHNKLLPTVAVFLALLTLVLIFRYAPSSGAPVAHAGAGQNISGFAWGSNFGWISFNCLDSSGESSPQQNTCATADYGVNVDSSTGNFTGMAWSSSIGYINFNPTPDGATGCAASPCAKMSAPDPVNGTRAVTGWVRACAVLSAADCSGTAMKSSAALGGWDGWIKLADPSWTNPADRTYMGAPGTPYDSYTPRHNGVFYDPVDSKFKGFAWGGSVVGWIDFFATAASGGFTGPLAIPVLTVNPAIQQDFGDVSINTTKTLNFTVTNTGEVGSLLKGSATVFDTTYFTCIAGCDYSAGIPTGGASQTVSIRFTPGATPGNGHTTTVNFSGTNTAPPSVASRTVLGNGIVPVSGPGLNFGNVVVGKTKNLLLTITNSGSGDLGSNNLNFPYPVFTCLSGCPFNLPPNSSVNVTIRFAPTATTTYNGNASLQNYPSVTFPFTGAGVTGSFIFREQ